MQHLGEVSALRIRVQHQTADPRPVAESRAVPLRMAAVAVRRLGRTTYVPGDAVDCRSANLCRARSAASQPNAKQLPPQSVRKERTNHETVLPSRRLLDGPA